MKGRLNALKQWTGPALTCLLGILLFVTTYSYLGVGQSEIDTRLEAYDALRRIVNNGSASQTRDRSISEQDKSLFHVGDSRSEERRVGKECCR